MAVSGRAVKEMRPERTATLQVTSAESDRALPPPLQGCARCPPTRLSAQEQSLVHRDSRWGLQAARAAEMHTIAVTNSYHADELSMAEKIVSNLSDLSINDLHQLCSKNRI